MAGLTRGVAMARCKWLHLSNNCDWQIKNRIHQAMGPVFGHRKQGDTPLHPYAENTHSQAVNGRLVETSRPYHENYMRDSLLNT